MTLLESIIAIFIASIVIVFTASSFQSVFQHTEEEEQRYQLLSAIHMAREEAIKQGTVITLCKSQDQKTCSGDWQDGYLVRTEDKIVFVFHQAMSGILHWRAFPYYLDHLEFLPSGMTRAQNGTFWYCLNNLSDPKWAIMISQSGRARIALPDKNGKIKDDKNKLLIC